MGADASMFPSYPFCRCPRSAQLLRELQHENIIQVQEVFLNHVTREVRPVPPPPPLLHRWLVSRSLLTPRPCCEMQVCFLFAFAEYDLLGIIQHHRLLQKSYDQRRQKGEAIPANKHLMPESLVSHSLGRPASPRPHCQATAC